MVDMWSIGVILYILLCGFPPFYNENTRALYEQIKRGQYDFPEEYWKHVSKEAKQLVSSLLTVNPKKRCTSQQLLAHPWICGLASAEQFDNAHAMRLQMLQARTRLRVNAFSFLFDSDPVLTAPFICSVEYNW